MPRTNRALNARLGAILALALTALAATGSWQYATRPIVFPSPREVERDPAVTLADFVGAERCAKCHSAEYDVWRRSTHGRAGGSPSPQTVVAPFGESKIVFANARVTPRVTFGTYEFAIDRPGEPEMVLRVGGVIGGAHIFGGGTQGFVTQFDDGTLRLLPFEWSRQSRTWFCNTNPRSGRGWTPITPAMRIEECADWMPSRVIGDHRRFTNCQSCHASQATLTHDTVSHRYATRMTSLAINCESCHGPGKRHVELAESGQLGGSADIGFASLATLNKDASLGVCYQCHAVKDRLRDGFVPGDSLEEFYSLKLSLLGDRPLFPDGRIRTFAYQEGHQYSECYLNGGMTCTSCHDPHSQDYRTVTGEALRDRFDDRQCTSCHASKVEDPTAHTKHGPSVRCTSCHMPLRQEPDTRARFSNTKIITYTRSDHTISIPQPSLDSTLGLATACSACHSTMSVSEQERQIHMLWGDIKPKRQSPSNTFAQFADVARLLETQIHPDGGLDRQAAIQLRTLAASRDVDVRAAALAALHLASGDERATKRLLASTLNDEGEHDLPLRSRWALVLGFMGDQYAAKGDLAAAVLAYDRALEVRPSNAALLFSRANAQRDAGDVAGAIASYRASIGVDRTNSLTWLNLGLAFVTVGDTSSAVTALTNATALDPSEPLAWFNLGNIAMVRGELSRAEELYRRTAALEPSVALAHFQLARVSLMRKDYSAALAHLRRGLAFDSSDASTRAMASELSRALGR